MGRRSYLSARTHESRDVAVRHLLDALCELGFVLDTRSFSGLLLVLELELPTRSLAELPERLRAIRVPLEAASEARVHALEASPEETAELVLDVNFVDGDPDRKQVVPMVPG